MSSKICNECNKSLGDDSVMCSVCSAVFHLTCIKKDRIQRSSKDQALVCQCCQNVSPAHIYHLMVKKLSVLDSLIVRITNIESGSEYMANEIKCISSKVNDLLYNSSTPSTSSLPTSSDNINTSSLKSSVISPSPLPKDNNISGWRLLGNKQVWKSDWTYYDEKIKRFNKAEKHRMKQRKQKKQIRTNQNQQTNQYSFKVKKINRSSDSSDEKNNENSFNRNSFLRRSFKRATTMETTINSNESLVSNNLGQNSTSSLNTVENSNFKFINFQKGETLYPGNGSQQRPTTIMDPLITPTINSTQISIADGNRYALSRLNNEKLYKVIRLYVAYLHDQPASVYHEGYTVISAKARIGSEGLPTDPTKLKKLFSEFNNRFDISSDDTQADLDALRNFCRSSKINEIQRNKENFNKFYNLNGNKKNF